MNSIRLTALAQQLKAETNPAARSFAYALVALAAGAASLASPVISLLLLALLATVALMRGANARIDVLSLAGPIAAALIVGGFVGLAGAIGTLFVWRLFADARWSAEEAARLARAESRPAEAAWHALAHAWTTPLFGLALVAYTAPHMVAGLPLDLPHVPLWVPLCAGVIAGAAVFDWALRRAAEWRLGELCAGPAAHLLAHHALFLIAFGCGLDVSAGIVAMIAWRLLQTAR
jgi:hypothetical protein